MTKHAVAAERSQAGFTLVELAIVMIIIGLLIGGVLKGQELIGNAQVTATVAQVKGIDAGTSTFRDIYDALPGDITTPNTRLANCLAAPCSTAGGDGNGTLEDGPEEALAAATENLGFFAHLAAADLISGVNAAATDAALNCGDEVPEAQITGACFRVGFTVGNPAGSQGGAQPTWRAGHYLLVSANPTVALNTLAAGGVGLTATQAARIDNKVDDGMPQSGSVRAGGVATCIVAGPPVQYDTSLASADCASFIRIQG